MAICVFVINFLKDVTTIFEPKRSSKCIELLSNVMIVMEIEIKLSTYTGAH